LELTQPILDKLVIEPQLLSILCDKIKPLLDNLVNSLIISCVKELADILISFGNEHQLNILIQEGEELRKNAESYDIFKMKLKIGDIEKLIR
jgi:hypothetical protein